MANNKEFKWSLLRRPGGVLSAMVTSVEKPVDKLKKSGAEYEQIYRADLAAAEPYDRIDLIIDSAGGSVASADGLCAAVLATKKPVRVLIDGRCMSAATMVAYGVGAKTVCITSRSHIMFHMPTVVGYKNKGGIWTALYSFIRSGTVSAMIGLYRARSKTFSRSTLRHMMENSATMTPAQAVETGFADKIVTLDAFQRGAV